MPYDFVLPDLGEGITEGEIRRWLVKEGDAVEEHQTVLEDRDRQGSSGSSVSQEGESS